MGVSRVILLAAILLPGAVMAAESKDPAGDKAMHDYVLTMPKVKAYSAGNDALAAATASDQSLMDESEKMDGEPDKTFADLKTRIAHHPRFYAFFSKQGLSTDDVVLIPVTLISACTAAQIPQAAAKLADRVSPAQITFCKDNMAALKAMSFFNGGSKGAANP